MLMIHRRSLVAQVGIACGRGTPQRVRFFMGEPYASSTGNRAGIFPEDAFGCIFLVRWRDSDNAEDELPIAEQRGNLILCPGPLPERRQWVLYA